MDEIAAYDRLVCPFSDILLLIVSGSCSQYSVDIGSFARSVLKALLQKRKNREEAEAQREAALAAGLPTPPTKRKHRTKNALPKLNFGVVKVAPRQPHVEERETRSVT